MAEVKRPEIDLPELDVTDAERACAESLTEEEWLAAYAMASPIELVAIRYCRERQLREALLKIASLERRLRIVERALEIFDDGVIQCEVGTEEAKQKAEREIDSEKGSE